MIRVKVMKGYVKAANITSKVAIIEETKHC